MAEIRAFIAVDLPQNIKMEIDKLVSGFRREDSGIRWVRAANLHLTLRFLGDIPLESVSTLAESLTNNLTDFGSFHMPLSGIGGFPNLKRPRVIWIGTGDATERLNLLASKVEKACTECGFGKGDKPFSSHMTIGRVKFPRGLESILGKIEKTEFASEKFTVNEIAIVKSDLSPAGPKYTKLKIVKL